MKKYEVVDIKNRRVVGSFVTLKHAHQRADRLDLEYGGVRYIVRRITT